METTAQTQTIAPRPNLVLMAVAGVLLGILFIPFFSALSLAAIFALALYPSMMHLQQRFKRFQGIFPPLLITLLSAMLTAPLVWSISKIVSQATTHEVWIQRFQNMSLEKIATELHLHKILPQQLSQIQLGPVFGKIRGSLFDIAASVAGQIPEFLFLFAVFLGSLYFFLSRGEKIRNFILSSKLIEDRALLEQTWIWKEAAFHSVIINAGLGILQAAIITAGAYFLADLSIPTIFLLTFFFSFVPVIGTTFVSLGAAIACFASGDAMAGWSMLVIALFAGSADNIVRALVVSHNSVTHSIHPVVALAAIIGGIQVFGFAGLFIGPVILTVAPYIYKLAYKHGPTLDNTIYMSPKSRHYFHYKFLDPQKSTKSV